MHVVLDAWVLVEYTRLENKVTMLDEIIQGNRCHMTVPGLSEAYYHISKHDGFPRAQQVLDMVLSDQCIHLISDSDGHKDVIESVGEMLWFKVPYEACTCAALAAKLGGPVVALEGDSFYEALSGKNSSNKSFCDVIWVKTSQ